jgi:transposase-like protein
MDLFLHPCPCCGGNESRLQTRCKTLAHNERSIYHCFECDIYFSETFATPIAGLKPPLSRIIMIFKSRSEGMRLNATARTHTVSKKSVIDWERRLGSLKRL